MTTLYFVRHPGYGKSTCAALVTALQGRGYTARSVLSKEGDHYIPGDVYVFLWGTRRGNILVDGRGEILNLGPALRTAQAKGPFRFMLAEEGLAPACILNTGGRLDATGEDDPDARWVVRHARHFGGKGLHVVENRQDAEAMLLELGRGAYASPLINKVREYRVMVVGGRSAWIVRKSAPGDERVAWNHGEDKWITCDTTRVIKGFPDLYARLTDTAVDAVMLAGLDFGAVDIMVRDNQVSYDTFVCEVNTAPSITIQRNIDSTAEAIDNLIKERSI